MKKFTLALLVILLFILSACSRINENKKDDLDEYSPEVIQKKAIAGDAVSQAILGVNYLYGEAGVKKDHAQALLWLKKSADQENAAAQYYLAAIYLGAFGEKPLNSESLKWLERSANNGYAKAQYEMGTTYQFGKQGVLKNINKAMSWYTKAAQQGSDDAQYNLGSLYDDGKEIPRDFTLALKFYTASAEAGNSNAQMNLGSIYYEGQDVARDYATAYKWYFLARREDSPSPELEHNMLATRGKMSQEEFSRAKIYIANWQSAHKSNGTMN